jgi:hypothetical protein
METRMKWSQKLSLMKPQFMIYLLARLLAYLSSARFVCLPVICLPACLSVHKPKHPAIRQSFLPSVCQSIYLYGLPISLLVSQSVRQSASQSACQPGCLAASLHVCLSECSFVFPSVCLCVCLHIFLSLHLSVCLSFELYISLSVCLYICLPICLSVHLSNHLFICLSVLGHIKIKDRSNQLVSLAAGQWQRPRALEP